MPELENNLMNFVLPFSLANLTQDKKTISREYTRSKKLKKQAVVGVQEKTLSQSEHLSFHSWNNQSCYKPLNLKNGSSVNSDNFIATDLRF